MNPELLNTLYSALLVVAIVALALYQLASFALGKVINTDITAMIVALVGLLQANRHTVLLRNGKNGSSGRD